MAGTRHAPTVSARVRNQAVNALVTALITLLLTFGTGLVRGKESVAAHNADVQRILDVLCEIKPSARACRAMNGTAGEVAQR